MDSAVYMILGSLLDMLAFYQVFMIYLIFFAERFELSAARIVKAGGIAFATSLICMYIGAWSVLWAMFIIVLVMGKKRLWESVLILPAIMLYTVLGIVPVLIVRSMVTVPEIPFLTRYGVDCLGIGMDVLGCIFMTVLYRILRKHKISLTLRLSEIFGFIFFFFFEIFLLVIIAVIRVHYQGTAMILLNAGCLIFFLIAIGVYLWHLITLRRASRLNMLVKQEENYIQCQLTYLEQYKNENQNIRALRHDLRGHLQMLKSLQEGSQPRKMELYLDSLQAETDRIKELEFTGNQAADIVLAGQRERAQKAGIPFVCEGAFQWLDKLKPMEVCSLFSNLLDNAYDASMEEKEPDISIKGGIQEHFWTLTVSNRAEKECKIRNNRMPSAKGENHGMGLGIVEQIVGKCDGVCTFSWEAGRFFCRILIPRDMAAEEGSV